MTDERNGNMKLGAFVLAGTLVLVIALYMIGSKQDLFSRTMDVTAPFKEVSGLRAGNNVRYVGIDVGTVKEIEIVSDTLVIVHMIIRQDAAKHILDNAVARIGSDGLMGNKLVSIEPGEGAGQPIASGDALHSGTALDTDAMLRTLGRSNDNLAAITTDLRELTRRMTSDSSLLSLLSDTGLVSDVEGTVHELHATASNARSITDRVDGVVADLQAGKGALGVLINDPAAEQQVRHLINNLQQVSDSLAIITGHIDRFTAGLNKPDGLSHALTSDTALTMDIKRMMAHLDTSSATLSEDLKALQRNFLLRRYFKEKAKAGKK